jgi:hypothetical protein
MGEVTPGGYGSRGSRQEGAGLMAAFVILLALPIPIGYQILFGSGRGTTIHFALTAGRVLLASSVFDFELPR